MNTHLQNKRGFSLIELLTVVAIIGILSMIGIPRYQHFRTKAYQVEARNLLSAVHAGESAFFIEYGGYHSSLKVLGVQPIGKARFNIGFGAPGVLPAMSPVEISFLNTRSLCSGTFGFGSYLGCVMNAPIPAVDVGATVSQFSYNAVAVAYTNTLLSESLKETSSSLIAEMILGESSNAIGIIPTIGTITTRVDGWGMNELKVMTHAEVDETSISCLAAHTCETLAVMPPDLAP